MTSRAGGAPIRTSKVKPGPDQAFTLPKGTSAAPIMQVKVKPKNIKQTKKPEVLSKKEIAAGASAAGVVAEKKFNLYDKAKRALKELITLDPNPKSKTGPKWKARKAKKPGVPKPVEVRRGGAIRRRGGGIAKRGMGIAK
jgi:hypothetical protein